MKRDEIKCNFCGKSQNEVMIIIAGPTVYICDECVSICVEIIDEKDPSWLEKHMDMDKVTDSNIIREVTLPPEYHQIGLSIIGYFSMVIKYKYPDLPVKTRIEQDGRFLRLVIRSGKETKEKFQHLLNDYALVIQGKLTPEQFFERPDQVKELQERLRITELELRRLIAVEDNSELMNINEKVLKLHNALGWILSQEIEDIEELFA
jgi:hypothetical protein